MLDSLDICVLAPQRDNIVNNVSLRVAASDVTHAIHLYEAKGLPLPFVNFAFRSMFLLKV